VSELDKIISDVRSRNGARQAKTTTPAPKTFDLLPEHFGAAYEGKPVSKITVGLRVPSESEVRGIESAATKEAAQADGDFDQKLEAYNRALFTFYVARGLCNPHDVTAPHPLFELPEDMIPLALTPRSIRRLFDEIELLHVEQSPIFLEATPEEVSELADRLAEPEAFDAVPRPQRLRALRYLRFVLDTLRAE
jgi:hypothetical protein